MKTITSGYKNQIKTLGREINCKITYTLNGVSQELGGDTLNSVTLHYEGDILKSVMKQLDIESLTDIPLETILKCQFGLYVGNSYEYIDLGNFIVYSSEKQEDTNSYKIICYDKMLYSMKDYESFATYPITIRDYIDDLCTHIGLTFANSSDTFPNYDKTINRELYLDENGYSLNYTFRDVLDELAQVTASTICINNDDELELRYITDTEDTIDEEYLKDINVNFGEKFGAVNTISLKRSADSDVVTKSIPANLPDEDKIEIAISDNQIMNDSNRADFIDDILDTLYGLEYYTNDFISTGITYYELCDMYNIQVGNMTYSCIMFNDEINITQGLVENIHTDLPKESKTDYQTASKDDRTRTRAELIVNKAVGEIEASVQTIEDIDVQINGQYNLTSDTTFQANKQYYIKSGNDYVEYSDYEVGDPIPANMIYEYSSQNSLEERMRKAELNISSQGAKLDVVSTNIDPNTGDITALKTISYELNQDGFVIDDGSGYKAIKNTTGDYYYDNDVMIGKYTKDGSVQKDLSLYGKYYYGVRDNVDVENFTKDDAMFIAELYTDNNGDEGMGHFYNQS